MEQNFIALVAQYFIQINNAQSTMRQMLEAYEAQARGIEARDARIAELEREIAARSPENQARAAREATFRSVKA